MSDQPSTSEELIDSVTDDGVFHAVQDGYEAVYSALPNSDTFNRLWRNNAYYGEFPADFAHIGFLTETEARQMLELLRLGAGDVLVDLACGAGGPGLWAARQSGANLIGIDPAAPGVASAAERARRLGLDDRAEFRVGTFERTGVGNASVDAVMTVEAFQYAPNKRAGLAEFARILKPGGRVAIVCFEVDPARVQGLPVLGVDPIIDYAPLLRDAGFTIDAYEETTGWSERVYGAFGAVIEASDALNAEMGERAAAGALSEAMLTVATRPYPRRILTAATRGA